MNLGATIKNLRKQQRQTQGEFATVCGISQTYLSQIENNQKEPNLSILKTIGEKLNVPLPIIFFLSLTDDDIQPAKREDFAIISPSLKLLINELFTI